MEEVTKHIDKLFKDVLPQKAHYLSLDTTRQYRPHADAKRLEEQDIRPLQYTTFISDAERGVLLTRAYFDVREEPLIPARAADPPTPRKADPSKPKTKLSLKDYKNRKRSPVGVEPPKVEPPKPSTQPSKPNAPLKKKPDSTAKEPEPQRIKKEVPDTKPSMRSEARRPRSPSPGRKRRVAEAEQEFKPAKRSKVESSTPNSIISRSLKDRKPERLASEKKIKGLTGTPTTNGKPAINNTGNKGVSPRPPTARVNGTQKLAKSKDGSDRKTESNSISKAPYVPPLLSPIDISDYMDDSKPSRPGPKKKPADSNNFKPPLKKSREGRDPSPSPKKRKIPPLLSPTLPPIVVEELARNKTTPSKHSNQGSSQIASESPNSQKKAAKSSKREETIYVDSGKGQREKLIVTLKYKKRNAKTVERLLNLPSGSKKKSDQLRREERAARDRLDGLGPGTARKRPAPDTHDAIKRPKASENARPSTPLGRSSEMMRGASNSSQVGTPGVANGLTPATQQPERRRPLVDQEKLQRLQSRASNFIKLGTQLKHERDAVLKNPGDRVSDRDRQVAIAAGIQCLVSFLLGFKLQNDASDLERKRGSTRSMRELLLLFRVTRSDCARHNALTALILRLQGICLVYIGRIMWSYPGEVDIANQVIANSKEQQDIWRQADNARRAMGVYDGSSKSNDGGSIGKLIDRLGPWTVAEEAVPVTLDVLRKVMQANGPWKPAESLTKLGHSTTNGISA